MSEHDPSRDRRRDRRSRERKRRGEAEWQQSFRREVFRARTLLALCLLMLLSLGTRAGLHVLRDASPPGWPQYRPPTANPRYAETHTAERFADPALSPRQRYQALFDYVFEGALRNLTGDGAHILFPGFPGSLGAAEDGFRGFARSAPLLAAMIANGGDPSGRGRDTLAHGIAYGTDFTTRSYWGGLTRDNFRADDAADIARALWLTRDTVWAGYSAVEKTRIAAWLAPLAEARGLGPRELLPAIVVERVLDGLGMPGNAVKTAERLRAAQAMLADGGFLLADGGRADLSNAWRESYDLFWINRIDPTLAPQLIPQVLGDSAKLVLKLVTPAGVPMFGDDICARTALPAPVLAAYLTGSPNVGASGGAALARAASDAVWRYFLPRGALRDGGLAQGYFGPDPALTPNETGPGSCQWGLRGLVLTMMLPANDAFWTTTPAPLPVTQGEYRDVLKSLGWVVHGQRSAASVAIELDGNRDTDIPLEPYGTWDRLMTRLRHVPARPDNRAARWRRAVYASDQPLAGMAP